MGFEKGQESICLKGGGVMNWHLYNRFSHFGEMIPEQVPGLYHDTIVKLIRVRKKLKKQVTNKLL